MFLSIVFLLKLIASSTGAFYSVDAAAAAEIDLNFTGGPFTSGGIFGALPLSLAEAIIILTNESSKRFENATEMSNKRQALDLGGRFPTFYLLPYL